MNLALLINFPLCVKYLKNKFIILLTFYTCGNYDNYSGIIEFTFNLDDYLNIDENNKN